MHVEVSVALNFVISYLYNKLPRRRVDMFAEELERGLKEKFAGHWYPEQPAKGSGYRCLRIGEKVDPLITSAMQLSGLELAEIRDFMPPDLTIWIDPNEVSHRIGERGHVKILYSHRGSPEADSEEAVADREIQTVTVTGGVDSPCGLNAITFNPEAQSFRPIETLSASLTNLSLSPSSPGGVPAWRSACASPSSGITGSTSPAGFAVNNAGRPAVPTTFTAASFAQTKFGSTKLKSQAKRPSRLSPTEFSGYAKSAQSQQRSPGSVAPSWSGAMSPARPQSLSPRDPRLDFIEHQQRMLFFQQQQQQQQQQHIALQNASLVAAGLGGSLSDLQHARQQPVNFADLLSLGSTTPQQVPQQPLGGSTIAPVVMSPDDGSGKAYLDASVNWNTLPPCATLQHMLVAN